MGGRRVKVGSYFGSLLRYCSELRFRTKRNAVVTEGQVSVKDPGEVVGMIRKSVMLTFGCNGFDLSVGYRVKKQTGFSMCGFPMTHTDNMPHNSFVGTLLSA